MSKLNLYNLKRDFSKTSEPRGIKKITIGKKLKYVIQHHLARKDHYDLRLEYNGVYISWAVPKGPSFNPKDKRLAIRVEDHPLSYGNFEGTIPKGEYGGGTVMLFDKGYYTLSENEDFNNGPLKVTFNGKILKGSWSLIKTRDNMWLLIKEKDAYENLYDIKQFKTSIKSGRTMDEIENNKKPHMAKEIKITNPDKIIFPKLGITKEDIVNYYKSVEKRIMPFLDNRLISTVRSPSGMNGEKFFMKHLNESNKNLGRKRLKDKNKENTDYYYIKNINGLLYEVQMNSYEFHIWGAQQNKINKPDILVFDLDPDEGMNIKQVRQGVKDLKKILDEFKLKGYLKTSGGKGYHIFIPFLADSWNQLESIAEKIAQLMVYRWESRYTINMRKENRKNKIFIDYYRNKLGATSVCPYSLRLKDKASISMPIFWNELDSIKPDSITLKNVHKRLEKRDPWAGFFS